MIDLGLVRLHTGDVLEILDGFPSGYFHCCFTSPPYWAVRTYLPGTDANKGRELGGEDLHDCLGWARGVLCGACYVCRMLVVLRAIRRVMRPDGVLWLNLGDSYAGSGKGQNADGTHSQGDDRQSTNRGTMTGGIPAPKVPPGLKPKDLALMPYRMALAAQTDGWWVRSPVTWLKTASMPESVQDRPSSSTEMIWMLTPRKDYYFDMEAVRQPLAAASLKRIRQVTFAEQTGGEKDYGEDGTNVARHRSARTTLENLADNPTGAQLRNAWAVAPEAMTWQICARCERVYSPEQYRKLSVYETGEGKRKVICYCQAWDGWVGHFATFPAALPRLGILASTSEAGCCPSCGSPYARQVEPTEEYAKLLGTSYHDHSEVGRQHGQRQAGGGPAGDLPDVRWRTVGWQPTCDCDAGEPVPCRVLEPFGGSGTTGLVCQELVRSCDLVDLNPLYVKLAAERIRRSPKRGYQMGLEV